MMNAPRRVVLAADGSDDMPAVSGWAVRTAQRFSLPLFVIRAVELPNTQFSARVHSEHWYTQDLMEQVRSDAEKGLADLVAQLRSQNPELEIDSALVVGHPARTVLDTTQDGDLLVVGRSSMTGLLGRIIGSTTEEILTHSEVPVAVIPASHAEAQGPVVVGLDEDTSSDALTVALGMAEKLGTSLHAVTANDVDDVWVQRNPDLGRRLDEMLLEDQKAVLAPVLPAHPEVPVHGVVIAGNPVAALQHAAEGASLVVVGSRGRGGFAGLLLGSTSRALGRQLDAPLIVVPNSQR